MSRVGAPTSITARTATSGGECKTAAVYRCRIGRGNTVTIAADAVATGPGVEVAWATTGAITASGHRLGAATPTFGPDNSIAAWKRTATVDLACTSGGTATAKATLAGTTAKKTARLTVVCADAVQITGLQDTSAEGTGTVAVARGFTVTPPSAECSADPAAATVTEGVGGARTLSARVAVPATLETVVTCTADGHADAVRHVALTARRPCSTHLGTLATGTVTLSGTITKGQCAAKARRTATESVFYAQGRHWAKRHTFTLDTPGWVTISLDNAPANAEALDTYLVLLKDDGNTGTPVARNDNRSRNNKNARLTGVFLRPGRYTIEATTKTPRTAGDYDLGVQATASGLRTSYTATVGAPKSITFNYWPPHAEVAARIVAAPELLPVVFARDGKATITLTPRFAGVDRFTVRIRSGVGANRQDRLLSTGLAAACPADKWLSAYNGLLCVGSLPADPVPAVGQYRLTPGTLLGVLETAQAVIDARGESDACGLTANKLAAFMLSIGYREIPHKSGGRISPSPARSPMTLGRADSHTNIFLSASQKKRNKRLYSDDSPAKEPKRAFFHAGVGWWQIDDYSEWGTLNHGQRAETGLGPDGQFDSNMPGTGGEMMADLFAGLYCGAANDAQGILKVGNKMKAKWVACKFGKCMSEQYEEIYLDNTDDLYVTIAENEGQYATAGGVGERVCKWNYPQPSGGSFGDEFSCWFYDTTRPEGRMHDLNPEGDTSIPLVTRQSPLAAPFVSFTYDSKRFAVFPGSILSVLSGGAVPVDSSRIRTVPVASDARGVAKAWQGSTYSHTVDGRPVELTLSVRLCEQTGWIHAGRSNAPCRWVSVNASDFASRAGIRAD